MYLLKQKLIQDIDTHDTLFYRTTEKKKTYPVTSKRILNLLQSPPGTLPHRECLAITNL